MNKIFNTVMALSICALSFSSCADVPAPYDDPNNGGSKDTVIVDKNDSIYLNETFASSFGDFTVKTVVGTPWKIDYKTAKATGYDNGTKITTASESYVVSKSLNLTKSKEAYLTFSYILRYASTNTSNKVLITSNYTNDPTTTTWTDITGTLTEGTDWNTFATYGVNIPTDFIGKNGIVIALYFKCNTTSSSTIEIKDLIMKEGKISGGSTTPATPTDGTYANETFESSFGSFTSKTVKGSAWIIDFKTAKATGYNSSTKVTTPSESYLVSSPMDMSSSKGATLSFNYILRYYTTNGTVTSGVADKVLVTNNYTGDPSTTTWTDMTGTLTEGKDWTTFSSFSQSIPSSFIGKKNIVVALYYACETSSSTWEVKNLTIKEGNSLTGGETTGGETTGNTTKVDMMSFGLANQADLSTLTLTDGTTLTFAQGEGSNTPKYYTSGIYYSARMYAKNTLTITSSNKKITSVILTCSDPYNGTNYNGNDQLYGTAGSTTVTPAKSGTTIVSFTGFSDNTLKIINDFTAASAGTQLRIVSLTITYAN